MSTTSRGDFLNGIAALRTAVTESAVTAPDATGLFIRRGLTVASYNLLETFVSDRLGELADRINTGHTQFLDLPERLQKRAIRNTLEVANTTARRTRSDVSTLRSFSAQVGESLSATGATLRLSKFTWLWAGSNMGPDDLKDALRFLHVDSPFESMRKISARLGYPTTDAAGVAVNFNDELKALVNERHECAHNASHPVTTVWLRAVPSWIVKYAITFDILASRAALLLRNGDSQLLSDDKYVNDQSVVIRFVRERADDYAEVVEGNVRATATAEDRELLYAAARGRCVDTQVLVEMTLAGEPVRWDIPHID